MRQNACTAPLVAYSATRIKTLGDGNFVKRSLSEKQQCLVNKGRGMRGRGPLASLATEGVLSTVAKTQASPISHPRTSEHRASMDRQSGKLHSKGGDGCQVCVMWSARCSKRKRCELTRSLQYALHSSVPNGRIAVFEESPMHQAPLAFTRIPDLPVCLKFGSHLAAGT